MSPLAETANIIFSLGAIVVTVTTIALIVFLIVAPRSGLVKIFGKSAHVFALLTSIGAIVSSLFYSEILGYAPCVLCWVQRILIYPQVILFLLIFKFRRALLWNISFAMSLTGLLVAIYHYYIESGGSELFECSAFGASCTARYVYEFGFVTIPFMSLALFAFLVTIWFARRTYLKGYPQETAGVSNI